MASHWQGGEKFIWVKRGGQGRGTPRHKMPPSNDGKSPTGRRSRLSSIIARRLVESSRKFGFVNGIRIGKK